MLCSFRQDGCLAQAFMVLQGIVLGLGSFLRPGEDLLHVVGHLQEGVHLLVAAVHLQGVGVLHPAVEGLYLGVGGLFPAVGLALDATVHLQGGAILCPEEGVLIQGAEDLILAAVPAVIGAITAPDQIEGGRCRPEGGLVTAISRMIRLIPLSKI